MDSLHLSNNDMSLTLEAATMRAARVVTTIGSLNEKPLPFALKESYRQVGAGGVASSGVPR